MLNPAFPKNNIAIAFAVNEEYLPYLSVTLQSIVETSNSTHNYDIIILFDLIDLLLQEMIHQMIRGKSNFSLRFISVSNYLIDNELPVISWHISTYYRLFLPSLYSGNKILWLDSDMLVRQDLADLWIIDLEDYYLGSVQDPILLNLANQKAPSLSPKIYKGNLFDYFNKYLGLPHPEKYFNAGLILFNLEKIRKDKLDKELVDFDKMKEKPIIYQDQDWLNLIFNDRSFLLLDPKWNVVTEKNALESLSSQSPEATKKPSLLHFTGRQYTKPWKDNSFNNKLHFSWWEIASRTPFASYLIIENNKANALGIKGNIKKIISRLFFKSLSRLRIK